MLYLALSILTNVVLFIVFRSFTLFRINTFLAIVVNYIVCVITGLVFLGDLGQLRNINYQSGWVNVGIILGILFLGTFYVLGITTQRLGVVVASVASKMSMIIPVLFSLFILNIASKLFDWLNYLGMIFALIAILFCSINRPWDDFKGSTKFSFLVLPLVIFIFGGSIDALINYANFKFLSTATAPIFPILIFGVAATIGLSVLPLQRPRIEMRSIVGGICLGVPNYFSVYFIIKALTALENDGAILYPLLNVGIIVFSSFAAVILFKEKLAFINKVGIILALLAIIMLSHQEIRLLLNV